MIIKLKLKSNSKTNFQNILICLQADLNRCCPKILFFPQYKELFQHFWFIRVHNRNKRDGWEQSVMYDSERLWRVVTWFCDNGLLTHKHSLVLCVNVWERHVLGWKTCPDFIFYVMPCISSPTTMISWLISQACSLWSHSACIFLMWKLT